MLRFVSGLCLVACLVQAAPTVHLGVQEADTFDYNTEQPETIDPIFVTTKPLVETSYVNPINMNYIPPTTNMGQQPVHQQPQPQLYPQQQAQPNPQQPQVQYYYFQPSHNVHPYNSPPYQMQPSIGFQWQDTALHQLPQQHPPIQQPGNTNVLPCTQSHHYGGGYQQYGY